METDNNALFEYKGWHIVRKIGSGSFGTVYEIAREDFGSQYRAALKVISIPQSEQDLSQIRKNIGKDEGSLEIYFKSVASEIVKEFEMMYKLKGFSNIVSYEDHEVRKHQDGIGWDIIIRMELLTPLDVYRKEHVMDRTDVIRLGIDICKALERCERYDIVHRDIKPANIFVSDQGDFKLGDFGIARTIEAHDAMMELSQKGTINYMAPEIYRGNHYDFRVDLYSLGIMMYRYLNQDTLPFFPLPPAEVTYYDVENAKQQRFGGSPLPLPCDDNTQLADIVLKACSFLPEDRYQSPGEMRKHLEMVLRGEFINDLPWAGGNYVAEDDSADEHTVKMDGIIKIDASGSYESQEESEDLTWNEYSEKPLRKRIIKIILRILLIIIVAVIVFIISIMIFAMFPSESEEKKKSSQQQVTSEFSENNILVTPEVVDLKKVIEQHEFVLAYKMIQDSVRDGENLDTEIQLFVNACQSEQEYKRAVAAMNLLSENVSDNETFYKDTVQWFYEHDKNDLIRQILVDLRNHGAEGVVLADEISLGYTNINSNEEEKNEN